MLDARRGDLRDLVGAGSTGAAAAALGAFLTGAFYAFQAVVEGCAVRRYAEELDKARKGVVGD